MIRTGGRLGVFSLTPPHSRLPIATGSSNMAREGLVGPKGKMEVLNAVDRAICIPALVTPTTKLDGNQDRQEL